KPGGSLQRGKGEPGGAGRGQSDHQGIRVKFGEQLKSSSNRPANKDVHPEASAKEVHRQKRWFQAPPRHTYRGRPSDTSCNKTNLRTDLRCEVLRTQLWIPSGTQRAHGD